MIQNDNATLAVSGSRRFQSILVRLDYERPGIKGVLSARMLPARFPAARPLLDSPSPFCSPVNHRDPCGGTRRQRGTKRRGRSTWNRGQRIERRDRIRGLSGLGVDQSHGTAINNQRKPDKKVLSSLRFNKSSYLEYLMYFSVAPKTRTRELNLKYAMGNLHFSLRRRIARIIRGVLFPLLLSRECIRCNNDSR